ncbi:hypothetical protein MPTK1_1g16540 [Marchantia polymorpha subsp. ruderalis]|uniref:Secreted protein n=2 Tax=Marchantia polymorpha TaxID=3197 RepID=A0AAF6AQV1_MARPO|nr:hypothetical protein MARPO_0033s0006 [Marchantia polymorpha]PTQ41582.1 hypothetical protein MARPO_0033s0006 [Marchantia polymorpha]BBM98821.1 hypothetical protein Mp_1g16540 [Marchantia polymorpha subsp. ruderalis]BBM98822.1 hypothetical protein Mp_1g16540 [Marchantia polymorpha subsp. ruderalis]|eukprot:PTQ41581.1 hypothetical protein MARPO_0033s0006 [Marchantia polymorpha]
MNRLATFLLVFVIALSLIASSSCGRQGYVDSQQKTTTTYIPRGRSHHKRVSKYDYGQGVSFHATVVESTLADYDYSTPRSNNLHDSGKFQRGGLRRRR